MRAHEFMRPLDQLLLLFLHCSLLLIDELVSDLGLSPDTIIPGCVALDKSSPLSEPPFLHFYL